MRWQLCVFLRACLALHLSPTPRPSRAPSAPPSAEPSMYRRRRGIMLSTPRTTPPRRFAATRRAGPRRRPRRPRRTRASRRRSRAPCPTGRRCGSRSRLASTASTSRVPRRAARETRRDVRVASTTVSSARARVGRGRGGAARRRASRHGRRRRRVRRRRARAGRGQRRRGNHRASGRREIPGRDRGPRQGADSRTDGRLLGDDGSARRGGRRGRGLRADVVLPAEEGVLNRRRRGLPR